ncbi:hypothetical protein [Flammeovirga kamogawensis]|uniref:Uncharacterized protein n=1 Tax=Flammeovirga kamogawensis TaxID=373891 RepID=A0ABX8H4Q0_9BACT|nr:hypothetical protein [Flammeovirga kamogawensis]MBB6463879.1 hypothetical protein [Flammeovirga kamogawensis]QWG10800.1 hypothetical protein KM029_26710 [Flammeovirga kamogawensis]TRX63213.1 hypothetical protein EO216_26520 [Flammeovirga kamogawensis]
MSKLKVLNIKIAVQLRPILSKYIITLQDEYKGNEYYKNFKNEIFKVKSSQVSVIQKMLSAEIEKKSGDHDAVELNLPKDDHNRLYLVLLDVLKEFKYQFLSTEFENLKDVEKTKEYKELYLKLKGIIDDHFGNVEGV